MYENFLKKTVNNEKHINSEIFKKHYGYHNPSFLTKDWHKVSQAKNEQIVNQVNDTLIGLRNAVNKNETPENKNPDKVINIEQQKGKRLKILTPKKILQRLLTVLPQVKAVNTSKNLLNEVRQIIYSLYWVKEIT